LTLAGERFLARAGGEARFAAGRLAGAAELALPPGAPTTRPRPDARAAARRLPAGVAAREAISKKVPDDSPESCLGCLADVPAGRPIDLAEHLHLGLERDPEALVDAAAGLGHQLQHVGGGRAAGVLDEVRVHR
jgi:hypothetical protein